MSSPASAPPRGRFSIPGGGASEQRKGDPPTKGDGPPGFNPLQSGFNPASIRLQSGFNLASIQLQSASIRLQEKIGVPRWFASFSNDFSLTFDHPAGSFFIPGGLLFTRNMSKT